MTARRATPASLVLVALLVIPGVLACGPGSSSPQATDYSLAAHWLADRQTGPLIARFGTEAQKQRFLPGICRGETYFCIGMSEPNAGSDLASIRTRATPVEGGGWKPGWAITF